VHVLRFIAVRDVASVVRACRRLRALQAECIWHVLARKHAAREELLDEHLSRLMESDCCTAIVRLPGTWPRSAGAGLASRVLVAACEHGRGELVRALLGSGSVDPAVDNTTWRFGGRARTVGRMSCACCWPTRASTRQHEAFVEACENGHAEVAELLLATMAQFFDWLGGWLWRDTAYDTIEEAMRAPMVPSLRAQLSAAAIDGAWQQKLLDVVVVYKNTLLHVTVREKPARYTPLHGLAKKQS
jgi:hypothetical protein